MSWKQNNGYKYETKIIELSEKCRNAQRLKQYDRTHKKKT